MIKKQIEEANQDYFHQPTPFYPSPVVLAPPHNSFKYDSSMQYL